MLVAVAPVSPLTISLPRTKNSANDAATMTIKYKRPAILALKRGDASAIRSIIGTVPILASDDQRKTVGRFYSVSSLAAKYGCRWVLCLGYS
jgi:hypothetical protein